MRTDKPTSRAATPEAYYTWSLRWDIAHGRWLAAEAGIEAELNAEPSPPRDAEVARLGRLAPLVTQDEICQSASKC
jgi:hypothetical protein